jgi:hypothetical protein
VRLFIGGAVRSSAIGWKRQPPREKQNFRVEWAGTIMNDAEREIIILNSA